MATIDLGTFVLNIRSRRVAVSLTIDAASVAQQLGGRAERTKKHESTALNRAVRCRIVADQRPETGGRR